MDPFSLTAGVIAVVQLAESVIKLCRGYIQSVENFPRDIRMILLEVSALKDVFQNLQFLNEHDAHCSAMITSLLGPDGPIHACRACVATLETCLSPERVDLANKRRKLKLSLESLAWHFKEGKVRQALSEIRRHKETITLAFSTEAMSDIKEIQRGVQRIEVELTASERRDIYKWLRHTDPSPNHNSARELYEKGTGDWVLRDPDWAAWMELKRRCIWIYGIPGAGKTILASHLIEEIERTINQPTKPDRITTCVYYYCYHVHNQDERNPLLRWMLDQLCRNLEQVPPSLKRIYDSGRQPTTQDLLDCLAEILTAFNVVYLVADALDESHDRHNLLDTLQLFCTDQKYGRIQLLVTSREYVDIARVLTRIAQPLSMSNPQVAEDMKRYVHTSLERDLKFKRWSVSLRNEVEDTLSRGAKGMFRWAVCQLDILKRLGTDADVTIREALKKLPPTLDETYVRILCSIDEELRPLVRHVLRWIIFRQTVEFRQFPCLEELVQSYKVWSRLITGQPHVLSEDMVNSVDTMLEACGCLVTRTRNLRGNEVLVLAHFTVSEFLRSDRVTGGPARYFSIPKGSPFVDFSYLVLKIATDPLSEPLQSPDKLTKVCYKICARPRVLEHTLEVISSFPQGLQVMKRFLVFVENPGPAPVSITVFLPNFWQLISPRTPRVSRNIHAIPDHSAIRGHPIHGSLVQPRHRRSTGGPNFQHHYLCG
ncbi:hypothetical protein V8F20_008663 [Naviculisporaceae sp. PSN 640]